MLHFSFNLIATVHVGLRFGHKCIKLLDLVNFIYYYF